MYSKKYIRVIYEHCPNIKILTLGINADDYDDFEILLKDVNNYKELLLTDHQKQPRKF